MESGGVHYEEVESIWTPPGLHIESGGVHMESTWSPVESTWTPYKLRMDSSTNDATSTGGLRQNSEKKYYQKVCIKHHKIQGQVGYHQIQKFKEILTRLYASVVAKNNSMSKKGNHQTPVGPPGLLLDSI
ncbi:hypothetical protein BDZ97DRAFT_1752482 [Flammula alnicola]|nr:hypothetical protein BDZ97DRAFT_1752482 [Flammula alnicola]